MTTHLLVALYKARRGGRERRANRYWQVGQVCVWGGTHAARRLKRDPHAQLHMQAASAATASGAFHTGPAGMVRPQVAMPTDHNSPPSETPPPQRWHVTQRGTACSSIRPTGTQGGATGTRQRVKQNPSVLWAGRGSAAQQLHFLFRLRPVSGNVGHEVRRTLKRSKVFVLFFSFQFRNL